MNFKFMLDKLQVICLTLISGLRGFSCEVLTNISAQVRRHVLPSPSQPHQLTHLHCEEFGYAGVNSVPLCVNLNVRAICPFGVNQCRCLQGLMQMCGVNRACEGFLFVRFCKGSPNRRSTKSNAFDVLQWFFGFCIPKKVCFCACNFAVLLANACFHFK